MYANMNWIFGEEDQKLFTGKTWFCPYHSKRVKKGGPVPKECDYSMEHLVNKGIKA
jgi:hypothetical protein